MCVYPFDSDSLYLIMQKEKINTFDKNKTLQSLKGSFGIERIKISDKFANEAYARVLKKIKAKAQ